MKRIYIILLSLSVSLLASAQAQMQTGQVKTRGRMVNGKHIHGQGLSGAVVTLKCNNIVKQGSPTGTNGAFSIAVPAKTFNISVSKNGYELVDADVFGKSYQYSPNPLFLVMETPEQRQEDKLTVERKIRRTLQKQLQEREYEIEALKEQNKITAEEYRTAIQKLYANQKGNEKLIAEMAERYVTLDYDQMDDFYREVNSSIEQGELIKADSLLRTRGDLNSQLAEYHKAEQVIQEKEEKLNKVKAIHSMDKEELARRCYAYYENFKMQNQHDSAVYYLELRVSLDTTNIQWQIETGRFIERYIANYDESRKKYQSALRQSLLQYGEDSEWCATIYDNMGSICNKQKDITKAYEYYAKALTIRKKVWKEDNILIANSLSRIGKILIDLAKIQNDDSYYAKALNYHQNAMEIRKRFYGDMHVDMADSYNSIANVYYSQKEYKKALECFNKALEILTELSSKDLLNIARIYNGLANVYSAIKDYEESRKYFFMCIGIFEKILGKNHPDIAIPYSGLSMSYFKEGDYNRALEYIQNSIRILEHVYSSDHPYIVGFKKYSDEVFRRIEEK